MTATIFSLAVLIFKAEAVQQQKSDLSPLIGEGIKGDEISRHFEVVNVKGDGIFLKVSEHELSARKDTKLMRAERTDPKTNKALEDAKNAGHQAAQAATQRGEDATKAAGAAAEKGKAVIDSDKAKIGDDQGEAHATVAGDEARAVAKVTDTDSQTKTDAALAAAKTQREEAKASATAAQDAQKVVKDEAKATSQVEDDVAKANAIVAKVHSGDSSNSLPRRPHRPHAAHMKTTELKCTAALQQQVDGNKVSLVKAYNLMSPSLPIKISGFPEGPYTSRDLASGTSYSLPDSEKSCPQQIQKNIHFIWFGKWLPDKFAKNIAGTAGINPTWTVMLWTTVQDTEALTKGLNSNLTTPNIVVKFTPDYAKTFFNSHAISAAENPAMKSDFMRLEVVYKHGGIYLDTDTVSRLPFDDFGSRFQWPFVVFDHGSYRNLCNCAFGAEAGSKFLLYTIKSMAQFKGTLGCPLFTGAFVRYNQTAIQMISSDNMLHEVPGVVQVQTQTFAATWLNGEWVKYQSRHNQKYQSRHNQTLPGHALLDLSADESFKATHNGKARLDLSA